MLRAFIPEKKAVSSWAHARVMKVQQKMRSAKNRFVNDFIPSSLLEVLGWGELLAQKAWANNREKSRKKEAQPKARHERAERRTSSRSPKDELSDW
jgi:hypothetical protein